MHRSVMKARVGRLYGLGLVQLNRVDVWKQVSIAAEGERGALQVRAMCSVLNAGDR
jgi:hypothetical protein